MTLYFNAKQLSLLLVPVIMVGVLLSLEDDIVRYMHLILPQHTIKKSEFMIQEANQYLRINNNKAKYDEISKKIILRKEFIQWMGDHSLYKKISIISPKNEQKRVQKKSWRVEAVFPKHDKAIINGRFVHSGSKIDNAEVVKIDSDKVLLKTAKGLKWVHLFH